jgi:hypothetical protein
MDGVTANSGLVSNKLLLSSTPDADLLPCSPLAGVGALCAAVHNFIAAREALIARCAVAGCCCCRFPLPLLLPLL